jgi:hypothetical protein
MIFIYISKNNKRSVPPPYMDSTIFIMEILVEPNTPYIITYILINKKLRRESK